MTMVDKMNWETNTHVNVFVYVNTPTHGRKDTSMGDNQYH